MCEIDDFDLQSFTATAASFGTQRYGYVVTPNTDQLIRYCEDIPFRALYRSAAFVLLDSRVVALVMRILMWQSPRVCPGSDLMAGLIGHVAAPTDRIVIIGGEASQAEDLRATYDLVNLHHHSPPMGFILNAQATEACLRFIEAHSPFRFCFLAVGSPQQEIIAERLQARGKARGLALCVGAAFNFLTGAERRAPRWVQRLALEWLFRLLRSPRRLAGRYLLRGPRILRHLLGGRLELRVRAEAAAMSARPEN